MAIEAREPGLGEASRPPIQVAARTPDVPRPRDVGVTEAGALTEDGVGRQAIVAMVVLGDGKRDLLAHLGSERAVRNGAAQAEQGRGRRLGGNAKHVGGDAETFLHGIEQVFPLPCAAAGSRAGIREMAISSRSAPSPIDGGSSQSGK
jgi:hypothetical protein